MRQYIRHPSDIPIEVKLDEVVAEEQDYLNDISFGGLSFKAKARVSPGTFIRIRIPLVNPEFEVQAKVAWCRRSNESEIFNIGVVFLHSEEAYETRMVEQVCHIEHYKREVREKEGREISSEQAALEWIKRYASKFPAVEANS